MKMGASDGRILLLLVVVVVGCCWCHVHAAVSQEDTSEATVSLTSALSTIDDAATVLKEESEALQEVKSPNGVEKVMKVARRIGKALEVCTLVSGVASFILSFFLPSDLDKIMEQFQEVNQKLDGISLQIESLRGELKSSIEFNTWMTTYIVWELDILNGEAKLSQTHNRLLKETDQTQKLKIMEEYVNYFENQDIEGKAMNIHKLTALESTTTRKNLFELLVAHKGCDVTELSRLMMIVKDLMTSAAKQTVTYQLLKHANLQYGRDKTSEFLDHLYAIRLQYDHQVWYCMRNFKESARREAQKVTESNMAASKDKLSKAVQERLSQSMPWYQWGVVFHLQAPSVTTDISTNCKGITVTLDKGQFFTLKKLGGRDDTNLLVVWQDADDRSHGGCHDAADAYTLVSYQPCSDCGKGGTAGTDNMVTGARCGSVLHDILLKERLKCDKVIGDRPLKSSDIKKMIKDDSISFVAAVFSNTRNPCTQRDICNSHGICRHIPDTSKHLCLCHKYYEGNNCEEYHNPDTADAVIKMVSSLRIDFSNFIGVPTVVDVYVQVRGISQHIETAIKYTQILILYGQVLSDAKYITSTYSDLQSGKLSEKLYAKRIEDMDFHRLTSDLEEVILGKGMLIQQSFLETYKKSMISELGSKMACRSEYVKSVSEMMKHLLTLDQAVTEAWLWYIRWQLHQLGQPNSQVLVNAQSIQREAQSRRQKYLGHWNNTSCPPLTTEDLQQRHCDAQHSYQGLSVSLTCANKKKAYPSMVTCKKGHGKLEWSASPKCVHEWGSWSSWSSCSKTCGGGRRTRTRRKTDGKFDRQSSACNTDDCCQAK